MTGLGKMQRRYLDAVTGQAGYYGIVEEGGSAAIVTVRLRVENRKLTEAEWYLARAERSRTERAAAARPVRRPTCSTLTT